ncbi:MAG TPA: sulfatase [Candidatus Eisenbacteria bacterium]|nr:sulfatase [Candidatus Eisenbacteria bacterium]
MRFADVAKEAPPSVSLADEWRPVLGRSVMATLLLRRDERVPAEGRKEYVVDLGPGLASAAWLVAHTWVHPHAGAADRSATALVRVENGRAALVVDLKDLPVDGAFDVAIGALPAPALPERDVVTAPIAIPAGGQLELAVGVQPEAWEVSPRLRFAVVVDEGAQAAKEIWSTVVDPASRDDRRWVPATIPVAATAGREVRLRFEVRTVDPADTRSSLPVWGDPTLVGPVAPPHAPNVLLISLDTLRADAVGAYGQRWPTTPHVDRELAGRGTLFERTVAPFPLTLPSHVSMLTGLYYRSHGVRRLGEVLAPGIATLAQALRAQGYATTAFTEDGFLLAESGIDRGFGLYDENKAQQGTGHAMETFGRGATWLRAHAGRRFFLFLHTYQVHAPYFPPEAYRTLFEDIATIPPGIERDHLRYLQEARVADDAVGTVLKALADLGLEDDTLVVLTSDHGEEFLEHGQRFHGYQLYDETLRVPLVLRWPGHVPAGRRVATPVSLVDLAPTILHLAGAPAVPGVDGTSLAPLLAPGGVVRDRTAAFSEAMSAESVRTTDLVAAETANYSCTRHVTSGELECYDLVRDPGQHARLAADAVPPSLVTTLDAFAARPQGVAVTPGGGPDAATRRNLEALGYVVGDDGAVGPAPGN